MEIKLSKRYKYAGDIFPKLIDIGFDEETAESFLNSIPDSDVIPKGEVDILKSLITRKEDEAYNRGYEDGKADIFNKLDNRLAYYRMYSEVNPLIATILQIIDDVRKEYTEENIENEKDGIYRKD